MPNTGWMYSGGGYILGQKVICDILNETIVLMGIPVGTNMYERRNIFMTTPVYFA